MLILGISDNHDASVTLIEDGEVLAAVSEERFTRKKRQQGFPSEALAYIKSFVRKRNVGRVYVSGKYGRAVFRLLDRVYSEADPYKDILSFPSKVVYWFENIIAMTPVLRDIESRVGLYVLKKKLRNRGIEYGSIELIDHHYSHIVSALTGIDSDDYIAVSLDAYGDGRSGLIINVENKKPVKIRQISYRHSIASFYASISAYLGFKEGDEGKPMALADYGKESALLKIFRRIFDIDSSRLKVNPGYKRRAFLKILGKYRKEDVSFALQKVVEDIILIFIKTCIPKEGHPDLFLAGGLFANIKINQRLHETGLFNRVFISPNMGDGGTAFVSAIHGKPYINNGRGLKTIKLKDIYLGPEYTDEYIKGVLDTRNLCYSEETAIEKRIASLLAEGKIIARFNGRMEYGPRALGNRSILCRTDDPMANGALNKRLGREGYMPFAPVTLFEFKDRCYLNIDGAEKAAGFMTIAFRCTSWMKSMSPAAVHIDGTARPQFLKKEDNPGFYNILQQYYNITGIPSLINTSFNVHNEPIVCSPEDAIRTFKMAEIDYLAMGRFLIKA